MAISEELIKFSIQSGLEFRMGPVNIEMMHLQKSLYSASRCYAMSQIVSLHLVLPVDRTTEPLVRRTFLD